MGKTNYNFRIHTGDECYAGTDSNIFVTLFGTLGQSDEYRLNGKIKRNAFERNQTDTLTLELPESIGDVYKIHLRSDCMYTGAGWLLDYIEITRDAENAPTCHFYCGKWIDNRDVNTFPVTKGLEVGEDVKKMVELVPSGEKLHVMSGQSINYAQKISIATGYSLKETKVSQIETNTSVNIGASMGPGGSNADAKTTSIKGTIEFALKTLNSKQDEKEITFDGQKEVSIATEIKNTTGKDAVYEIMLNVVKNIHSIKVGGTTLEVPEYLSTTFGGVRKV